MSYATRAKDRSGKRGAPVVALFPFLAVLVCTMGALVVVLVVLARQSRLQASQAATVSSAEAEKDLKAARELVEWRVSEWETVRDRAQTELAQARLKLGNLEGHSRDLREQLARLEAAWKDLDKGGSQEQREQDAFEAERARLMGQIAAAQKELDEARRAAEEKPKSYAVVPYQGPNGTRRRPIYLECRADTIVLQPEGIVLVAADFEEPIEAGNPLDRALRAARESMVQQGLIKGDGSDEPYPLLLVRPDGVAAYYAARAAMKSWKGEIGYELIGGDWKLAYREPVPAVARTVREAVEQSRGELTQKRILMAALAGESPRPTYRAAPGGRLIREGGPADDTPKPAKPARYRALPGGGLVRDDDPDEDSPRLQWSHPPVGNSYAAESRRRAAASAPEGTLPAPRSAREAAPARPAGAAQLVRPGEWIEPPPASSQRSAAEREKPDEKSKTKSLAQTRGRNWGLPDATPSSTGLTRTIRVNCHCDRLEILRESDGIPSQVISLRSSNVDFVDAFVAAVWEHMKGWGIAGRGMYWKPTLRVNVLPGAEARYEEICSLLEGSGLDIHGNDRR